MKIWITDKEYVVATEEQYEDMDTEQETQTSERSPSDWAMLRKTTKRAERAEQELAALKREHSFSRAGINLEDPRAKYFIKGYDGELEVGAIRSAATEIGLLQQPESPQAPNAQTAGRIRQAANGAIPNDGGGLSGVEARLDEAYSTGGNEALVAQLEREGFPITYE